MAYSAQRSAQRRRRAGHGPLWAPLLLFTVVALTAAVYVGYVLWPRWPEPAVTVNAPSVPVVVAGISFNIEPAAIRNVVQRRPGTQGRIDLVYLWPSLTPPAPDRAPSAAAAPASDFHERLFVTIQNGDGTLPPLERMRDIYPRYLEQDASEGPPGLTVRGFRDDTAYQGEQLAFDAQQPAHFLARCTVRGVTGAGTCLLERRVGDADITVRFSRALLSDWQAVASGIDRLLERLHPGAR